jgi:hypothetical protein
MATGFVVTCRFSGIFVTVAIAPVVVVVVVEAVRMVEMEISVLATTVE